MHELQSEGCKTYTVGAEEDGIIGMGRSNWKKLIRYLINTTKTGSE